MNFYLQIFSLLLCILAGSCNSESSLEDKINKLYEERGISIHPDTKVCIILPEGGCSGCIAGGMYHIISQNKRYSKDQKEYQVVFTGINSLKMLKRNLDPISLDDLNCIVDTDNIYMLNDNNKIYPAILKCSNGKVIEAQIQSPKSQIDYFNKLTKSKEFNE